MDILEEIWSYVANFVNFCSAFAIKMHFNSQIDQKYPQEQFIWIFHLFLHKKLLIKYNVSCQYLHAGNYFLNVIRTDWSLLHFEIRTDRSTQKFRKLRFPHVANVDQLRVQSMVLDCFLMLCIYKI